MTEQDISEKHKETDDFDLPPHVKERLKLLWDECFHPKALWQTFKANYKDVLLWITFFMMGWWLASMYYNSIANEMVIDYITQHCSISSFHNITMPTI